MAATQVITPPSTAAMTPSASPTAVLSSISMNKPHLISRKRSASTFLYGDTNMIVKTASNKKARTCKPKKSVRFDMSRNTLLSTRDVVDDSTASSTWLSADELSDIRMREANVIKIHKFCDYYLHQVTCILGMACGASGKDTLDEDMAALKFVCQSPARGLEKEVLPCVRQRRKQVVETFLKSQAALQQWRGDAKQFTKEFQQRALSQHYTKLARPSVRLAQLIAQGDADEVASHRMEEPIRMC